MPRRSPAVPPTKAGPRHRLGGDGTLNEVINGLAAHQNGHRVPLALLPAEPPTFLAKRIGLALGHSQRREKLVRGTVKEIALGLATPLEQPEKKKVFP